MVLPSPKGQGALEYLLLIGGGVLVAVIAMVILFLAVPGAEDSLGTSLTEYEKVDLCTNQDSSCNLFLDWDEGLSNDAQNSFVLKNLSSWRTLYVTGMTTRLICGNRICTSADFPSFMQATFTFPLEPLGGSSSSQTFPLPLCDATDCEVSFDASPNGFVLSPLSSRDIPILNFSNITSTTFTGFQIQMHSSQISDTSPSATFSNPGVDTDAASLSWYTSFPLHSGSTYQCQNLSSGSQVADFVDMGVRSPMNALPFNATPLPRHNRIVRVSLSRMTILFVIAAGPFTFPRVIIFKALRPWITLSAARAIKGL